LSPARPRSISKEQIKKTVLNTTLPRKEQILPHQKKGEKNQM